MRQGWECQGRQYHGWFGDGTCADTETDDPHEAAARAEAARRTLAVVYGAVGALSEPLRGRFARWLDRGNEERLAGLLEVWSSAAPLDADSFATRFLPLEIGKVAATALHAAWLKTVSVRDVNGERLVSHKVADSFSIIGFV